MAALVDSAWLPVLERHSAPGHATLDGACRPPQTTRHRLTDCRRPVTPIGVLGLVQMRRRRSHMSSVMSARRGWGFQRWW